MTRSQIFKSARRLSIGVLAVALAGAAGIVAIDPWSAFGPATLFEGFSLLSMIVASLGAVGTGYLLVCGLARERGYDPVAVWTADVQYRRRALRGRVRSAIDLRDSGIRGIRTSGTDLVLDVEAYVHQSTGQPGYDAGTGWYFRGRVRIRAGRVRGCLPRLPGAIEGGALHVGSRQLGRVVPAPFEFQGLTRLEVALEGGELLVIEGDGVRVTLDGPGRFIENREA